MSLSQEWKEFLSSLAQGKTFMNEHVYQYQGFWYTETLLHQSVISYEQTSSQDCKAVLVSNPKCGTTWLKAITFALLNRKEYPLNALNHPLLTSNPHDLVPFLKMGMSYDKNKVVDIASFLSSSHLQSTHMPYVSLPEWIKNDPKCKLVYICRNPKDTFVSIWHFCLKLGLLDATSSIEKAVEYFCEGVNLYGPFWDHVLEYWEQSMNNPERVLFLKYEDLKAEPELHLRRLANFLDCPFSADEEESGIIDQLSNLCSFDNLSTLKVNKTGKLETISQIETNTFFRRGEVGDWKNYLSAHMAHKIDQVTRLKFSGSGLVLE